MLGLGEYIKGKRKEKGLSAQELSRRSGISQAYLSQLENDKNDKPSPDILNKLANGLGIPNGDLLIAPGYIEDPFDVESNIIKTTDIDLRYILNIKEEAYYNGKPLTPEQKKQAVAILDALFKDN
jgi:transcriptional regulator with XRE-family HTH domain